MLPPESDEERERRERLALLAWLLDSSIPIPGTQFTVGLDAVIGLLPFIGDLLGVVLSGYILAEANRMGVGRRILARMAFNVAIDGVVGIVPLFGDVFDAAWKANQKNVKLLNAWAERPHRTRRASGLFLAALALASLAFLAACAFLAYLLLHWLVG
ncbi:MAG TPA: DUF4112 domain-containing protein [Burkholderiales bacterium]|nr:DUF4112 domain-containing protein [Burkholderiales bacterium]